MRSLIKEANPAGIRKIVEQQFAIGRQILAAGLIPILEPEVDIHSATKAESEKILKEEILRQIAALDEGARIMLKLTIPTEDDFYLDLIANPRVVRVVALSAGIRRARRTKSWPGTAA
jgi:fructose-bisphosphate aldolase class I